MINGFFQILFQLILISTGNLSFLNWLTILPSLWFFDDKFLANVFTTATVDRAAEAESVRGVLSGFKQRLYRGLHLVVALLLSYLSFPIVANLVLVRWGATFLCRQPNYPNVKIPSFKL
jgi:hypothetical protein